MYCHFYNRNGCNRTNCTFVHDISPPCKNYLNGKCRRKFCMLTHPRKENSEPTQRESMGFRHRTESPPVERIVSWNRNRDHTAEQQRDQQRTKLQVPQLPLPKEKNQTAFNEYYQTPVHDQRAYNNNLKTQYKQTQSYNYNISDTSNSRMESRQY